MSLKSEINGNRITLKKAAPSFELAKEVFALIDCSREHLLPWLGWANTTLRAEDSYGFLSFSDKSWSKGKEFAYAIFKDNIFMGFITVLNVSSEHKRAEIGYWIGKPFAQNGYIQEAVKILEKELFDNDFNKLIIHTDVQNEASANVARKCGYVFEGVLRQHIYSSALEQCRDINVFSKLKQDYI